MAELVVRRLLFGVVSVDFFIHPWNLVPQLYKLEIEVCAKKANLTFADGACGGIDLVAMVFQRNQGAVAAADGAVEVIPQLVHVVGGGSGQR